MKRRKVKSQDLEGKALSHRDLEGMYLKLPSELKKQVLIYAINNNTTLTEIVTNLLNNLVNNK